LLVVCHVDAINIGFVRHYQFVGRHPSAINACLIGLLLLAWFARYSVPRWLPEERFVWLSMLLLSPLPVVVWRFVVGCLFAFVTLSGGAAIAIVGCP